MKNTVASYPLLSSVTSYLSDAPQAVPHAAGFSSGAAAPHAVPHAAGFSSGAAAPQAVPHAAGFSSGAAAPQAVPHAADFCLSSSLFHPKMFESAIFVTSCK